MSFLAPDFAPLLAPALLAELEANANTVVGLRADLSVGYRNAAWTRFALANGAPDLARWEGGPVTEVFSPPIRSFYRDLFQGVQGGGEPRDHEYECSSPSLYRAFRLRVLPLPGRALLCVHHLVAERPHDRPVAPPDDDLYRDGNGLVTVCCHCRRTRRARQRSTWDWVPAYVDRWRGNVSHGLCVPCFRHHHPDVAERWDRSEERG